MATKIEKLKESIKKEQERLDKKMLKIVYGHIRAALTILDNHPFRSHRAEQVIKLFSALENIENLVEAAATNYPLEDSPAEVK